MRIVIVGGKGQLGRELERALSGLHEVVIVDLPECNIVQPSESAAVVGSHPDLVIHTAAMTDVDGCARDPLTAYQVNALGTQNVALACQRANVPMLYISTNEVFDGTKDSPYLEFDETHAINAYGASKLAGERYVQMFLQRFYIVRTAWLFSPDGNHFPKKIVTAAQQNGALRVTADEIGNPTYVPDLARSIAELIQTQHFGIYHLVNEGSVSRFDYAALILKMAGMEAVPLTPVPLDEWNRPSVPPRYGALANFCAATSLGIKLRPWEDALEEYWSVVNGAKAG